MLDPVPAVRRLLAGLAVCLAAVVAPGVLASESTPATQVVEALHRVLSEHLAPPAREFTERLERLEPVVAGSFDFAAITRVALGPAFQSLDDAARARFTDILRRLSALTYAERFTASNTPARFVTVSHKPVRGGRTLVRTRLERDSDEPVTLDYVLVETPAGPRIVNVLANGVSDLSLKRAEYAAVIRTDGITGLERRLLEQMDALVARAEQG